MSINLTDEIDVKTKKGKLGAAKQIFLEGDTQTVEKEIQDINSRHNTLNTKHESLSRTVQGIAVTGGANTATNVTYNNDSSGLNAENAQDAIDELQNSKFDKTSILQELGEAEDKVMSQKATTTAIADEVARAKAAEQAILFDVSSHNNGAVFESLSALLSSPNLSTLIPTSVRHGGMTILFVQSSDNKYVQFRYLLEYADTIEGNAAFVDTANWQGIDDVPATGSKNLVESGGVKNVIEDAKNDIRNGENVISYAKVTDYQQHPRSETYFNFRKETPNSWSYNSSPSSNSTVTQYTTAIINVSAGTKFYVRGTAETNILRLYLIADANNNVLADARMSPAYTRNEHSPMYQFDVDCRVFMNILSPWDNDLDGVFKEVTTYIGGTDEQYQELQENISSLSGRIGDIEDDVTALDTDINGREYDEFQQVEMIVDETGYWGGPFNNISVGDTWNYNSGISHSQSVVGKSALRNIIPANAIFKIKGYNGNSRAYVIVAKPASGQTQGEVLAVGELTSRDVMTNEFTFNTECKVFMTVDNYQSTDGVYVKTHIIKKGLKEEVNGLKQNIKEEVNGLEKGIGDNPFKGKRIVTIGDSLCTSGKWQQRLCDIIGAADFNNIVNIDPSYPLSVGGTSMYGTKKDMGLCRVRNLEHLDFTPDIILLENCNDKSAFYINGSPLTNRAGLITDKPYIVKQVIENVATQAEWKSNPTSILASIPSANRKFGTMLMITSTGQGKNVKPTTVPSTAGIVTLTLSGGGLKQDYSIHVDANESLSSIISKILEYDYAGYSDTLASDGESVDFFQESGLTNLRISYNANGTGLVLNISDTSTAKSQNGVFFDGESLSDWEDSTKWLDIIPLYRAWKGVIEYCNIHYPNAKLYILGFLNRSGHTSSEFLNADGTYDQDTYKETQAREEALVTALKNLADMYSIPFVDVGHNDGINVANLETFYPGSGAHPYDVGYNRWGEVIASLMK